MEIAYKNYDTSRFNKSKVDVERDALLRMSQVLSKFASTLTLRPISCSVGVSADVGFPVHLAPPSWSTQDKIVLNADALKDVDNPETLIAIRGFGLHETAHIQFTPKPGSKIYNAADKLDALKAFNILEDSRIETIYTSQFGNVSDWFTGAVALMIKSFDQEDLQHALPLIWGRKYLDKTIRDTFYNLFTNSSIRDTICALIDEYITLNITTPSGANRAIDIIYEFHKLIASGLASTKPQTVTLPDPTNPGSTRTYETKGGDDGWGKVPDANHSLSNTTANGVYPKSDKPSATPASSADIKKMIAKVNKELAQQKSKEQSQSTSNPNGNGKGFPTPNKDVVTPTGTNIDTVRNWAKQSIETIKSTHSKTIETMRQQANGELSLDGSTIAAPAAPIRVDNFSPSVAAVSSSKSFAVELEQLKTKYDPAWNRKVESGKLNVERYSMGGELDEAFDQWDTGREDAVDIECVILLDVSGSMGNVISKVTEYMWSIKRAMDKVNANTTVVTFSNGSRTLYGGTERADSSVVRSVNANGGTDPLSAIRYGQSVLANSDRAIKVLIPITDGEWSNHKASDELISNMRKAGVITALAYIDTDHSGRSSSKVNAHQCEVAVSVSEPQDLFHIARAMVNLGINRNLDN